MKKIFSMITMLGLLTFIVSCHLSFDKKKADFSDFPWPDMDGVPPDKSVKNWVKFDLVGTMDHPFSFLWFSPQEFERRYPNVLFKLTDEAYDQFKIFVRANQCTNKFEEVSGDPVLRVTEYADDHQIVHCIISPEKACDYMTRMYSLSQIEWTTEQTEELRLTGNDLRCEFINNKFQPVKY